MKRLISLALCCVIAASTFASCAQTPAKNYSPKITVSSSEADTYASWLTNRLGDSLENSVYLALGNDSGIDLSNFENDGYVIRTDGASAVIAGKTATGLDMAVRTRLMQAEPTRSTSRTTKETALTSFASPKRTLPNTRSSTRRSITAICSTRSPRCSVL